MDKLDIWKVTINGEREMFFDVRPFVVVANGKVRITGLEGETWLNSHDVTSIEVETTNADALLTVLDQKDYDRLMMKADKLFESSDGEDRVIAELVSWCVSQYRIRKKGYDEEQAKYKEAQGEKEPSQA